MDILRHEIRIESYAFALHPVELSDAPFIVQMRSDPERTRYMHPIPLSVAEQEAYIRKYFEREDDYYFVITRRATGDKEGLAGIYGLDREAGTAEWGRWILRPGSLAAVESALLVYRTAFERLGLAEVYCRTVAENLPVLSFHDSCGLVRRATLPAHTTIGERAYDVVEHVLTRERWPGVREGLSGRAMLIAERLDRATRR